MANVKIENWQKSIDELTIAFNEAFGDLSNDDLNWKINAETWSIAQNIDHIMVINETYYPVIEKLRAGTYTLPFIARFAPVVNWFGKFILQSVESGRKKKMKTFPIWQPHTGNIAPGILDRFAAHHKKLKAVIESAADLVDKNQVISSPANRMIVYKLGDAFDIIIEHERRHLNQAKEAKGTLRAAKW